MTRPHPTVLRSAGMLRRVAVAAFGATMLVAGVATAPATAAPAPAAPGGKAATTGSFVDSTPVPGGFASWKELLTLQQRMNTAAARITKIAQRDAKSGFAGVVADPATRKLQVYWKGEAPASLVATSRATVPTEVLPAAYTRRELDVAAAKLRRSAGDKITTVGPRADGAGLLVGTQSGLLGAASLAGVPVTVQTGVAAAPATRWDDSPPVVGRRRLAQRRHRRRLFDRLRGLPGRGDAGALRRALRQSQRRGGRPDRADDRHRHQPQHRHRHPDHRGQRRRPGVQQQHRRGRQRGQRVQQPGDRRAGQPGRQLRLHLRRVLRDPLLDPGEGPRPVHQRA